MNTTQPEVRTQSSCHPKGTRSPQSSIAWGPTVRMVLLIALGAMLTVKVARGGVLYYVNGVYTRLILASGLALLILGYIAGLRWIARADRRPARHLHADGEHAHATGRIEAAGYAMLAVPLLFGLLVPARPLGSAALDARSNGGGQAVPSTRLKSLTELGSDSARWTLLDWNAAITQTTDARTLAGKPVSLTGFAAPGDGGLGAGYFTVARFVIVCCVADGNAVTLPVKWQGSLPPRDTWLSVQGTLAMGAANGKSAPYIAATSIQTIPQPSQPYLYP